MRREKAYLLGELARLRLTVQSGKGCFVMVKLPMSDTLAYCQLIGQGVMVRFMTGFRYPNWIRINIGRHEAMEAAVAGLGQTR